MKPLIGTLRLKKNSNLKHLSKASIIGSFILVFVSLLLKMLGLDVQLNLIVIITALFCLIAFAEYKADEILYFRPSLNWIVTISALAYIGSLVYLTGGIISPFTWLFLVWVTMEMLWISVDKGKFVALLSLFALNTEILLLFFARPVNLVKGFNPYSSYTFLLAFDTGYMVCFLAITYFVSMLVSKVAESRDQLSVAKKKVEDKVNQLSYFYDISKKTTALQSLNSLANFFVKKIVDILGAQKCELYLSDNEALKVKKLPHSDLNLSAGTLSEQFCLLAGLGFKAKKRIVFSNEDLINLQTHKAQVLNLSGGRIGKLLGASGEILYIPLVSNEKLIGFLIAQGGKEQFAESSISLVKALSPQMASVVQNSMLFKEVLANELEAKRSTEYLKKNKTAVLNILDDLSVINAKLEKVIAQTKSMYRVAVDISRTIEQEKLLESILNNAVSVVNASAGIIMLKLKTKLVPYKEKNIIVKSEDASFPGRKAFDAGKSCVSNNLQRDYKKFQAAHRGFNRAIAVPLMTGRKVIGSICLFNKQNSFNKEDLKLLITLANQATISLLNAQIFEREKETVRKLKEIDKMKDDFVASVSHELKSPLTSIKGYLEILLEGEAGQLSKQQLDFLSVISQSSKRLHKLIIDLLTFAKIESDSLKLHKKSASLSSVLKKTIASMKPEIEKKHLKLQTNIKTKLPGVIIDNDRIEQVVLNLLTNAIKFTPENGTIVVSSWQEDASLITAVRDDGIGISKMGQKKLFTKFYRTSEAINRRTPGTGLGLAICKGIIGGHGGKIWVESKSGKGSTFYFSLPIK